jgi:hypothetical protein
MLPIAEQEIMKPGNENCRALLLLLTLQNRHWINGAIWAKESYGRNSDKIINFLGYEGTDPVLNRLNSTYMVLNNMFSEYDLTNRLYIS